MDFIGHMTVVGKCPRGTAPHNKKNSALEDILLVWLAGIADEISVGDGRIRGRSEKPPAEERKIPGTLKRKCASEYGRQPFYNLVMYIFMRIFK